MGSHLGSHPGAHFGWHFGGGVPGLGPAGDLETAIDLEVGARVTYAWLTNIVKAADGTEQRIGRRAKPRQRYAFETKLSDAQQRQVLRTLARDAHRGLTFLLGLSFEERPVVSSVGAAVTVPSLAFCDWDEPGQRVLVVHPNGTQIAAVVQSSAGATITLDVDVSALAVPGARIMPAMAVLLEQQQQLGRYRIGMGTWSIAGHAVRYRYGAAGGVGSGAALTMYDGMPVWDFGVVSRDVRSKGIRTGTELVDGGGAIEQLARYTQSDWPRQVTFDSSDVEDWQWFKLFLDTINGARLTWLLPTGEPDLVPIGDASTGDLTIAGGYVTSLWPSTAHRRIRIVLDDGSAALRTIEAAVDNGDGTDTLTLDSALAGTIARVELVETVRLDGDEVTVTFHSWSYESTFGALVVQQ